MTVEKIMVNSLDEVVKFLYQSVTNQTVTAKTGKVVLKGNTLQDLLANTQSSEAGKSLVKGFGALVAVCENPSITLATKASKQGFNIAGFAVKDGESLVANGALSVTDSWTVPLFKVRFNIANGALSARGHVDLSKTPSVLDEVIVNARSKNLVLDAKGQWGETLGMQLRTDTRKLVDAASITKSECVGTELARDINKKIQAKFYETMNAITEKGIKYI